MFSFMAETFWPFYKNFQGFTYCSVFNVRCCFSTATRLSYHNSSCLSTTFFIYFLKFFRTSVPLSATRIIISQVFDTVKHFFKFFQFFCTFLFSTFFPGIGAVSFPYIKTSFNAFRYASHNSASPYGYDPPKRR